jgi:threonine dehydrogenase-like Zn-dependent dehydrogenase
MAFALPDALPDGADVVFHTSASAAGFAAAIACAGTEASIVEASWYGTRAIPAPLGGTFHSRRLRILASQVGMVAPSRRPRWPHRRRLAAALDLLADTRLDILISDTIDFADAPHRLPTILAEATLGLPPLIRYPDAETATGS